MPKINIILTEANKPSEKATNKFHQQAWNLICKMSKNPNNENINSKETQ